MTRSPFPTRAYLAHGLIAFVFVVTALVVTFKGQIWAAAHVLHGTAPESTARVAPVSIPGNEALFLQLARSVGQQVPAERLLAFKAKLDPAGTPRYWAIVDFNQNSTKKRLYVFDTVKERVDAYYVAHGRGSEGRADDGLAENFSNDDGSFSSSLGIYRTLDEYTGQHGRSLRIEGLEATNSNALRRSIVIHTADYVSQDFIRQTGRLGRSEGCFAVERAVGDTLISELKGGAYLIAWKS